MRYRAPPTQQTKRLSLDRRYRTVRFPKGVLVFFTQETVSRRFGLITQVKLFSARTANWELTQTILKNVG